MPIDFDSAAFEEDFLDAATKAVEIMLKQGPDGPYYGFCLYADGFYTDCGVYFATESSYQASLSQARPEYIERKEDRWERRWNCGDWGYSSFGPGPQALAEVFEGIMGKWAANASTHIGRSDLTNDDWWAYASRVLEGACRTAIRLESKKTFQELPRTDDFHIVISDHDEMIIESYLRLDVYKSRGVVLLSRESIDLGLDLSAELQRILEAWPEGA